MIQAVMSIQKCWFRKY